MLPGALEALELPEYPGDTVRTAPLLGAMGVPTELRPATVADWCPPPGDATARPAPLDPAVTVRAAPVAFAVEVLAAVWPPGAVTLRLAPATLFPELRLATFAAPVAVPDRLPATFLVAPAPAPR
jgi:hypothetical protein